MDTHQHPTTTSSMALPSAWIDRLFQRLFTVYGNKFADMWTGQHAADVKASWASELSGYSADEIRCGLEGLRKANPTWPPTLFEFMELCRPVTPQLEPETAFVAAVHAIYHRKEGRMGNWPSKAVYWAMVDVGEFDVLASTWPQIRARWTKALKLRSDDGNLPDIPEPPKQLTAPVVTRNGDDERLDGMRRVAGEQARTHPRAWVQKILDRRADGDQTLPEIAYRMAVDSAGIR